MIPADGSGCCAGCETESIPMLSDSYMGETVIEGTIIDGSMITPEPYDAVPNSLELPADSPMMDAPPIEDAQIVEAPEIESDADKTSSAKPPTEEMNQAPPAIATEESDADSSTSEPSPFDAPTEPMPAEPAQPEPTPVPDTVPDEPAESMDDLFADPPAEPAAPEPAMPEPVAPEPVAPEPEPAAPTPEPAAPEPAESMDDLFGEPAAPADEPATDGGLDDLFGGDAPEMPTEMPAEPAGDSGLDDLFGSPADEPAMDAPAEQEPASGLDDLFGDPPADSPSMPEAPADGGLDDLFGDPPADSETTSDLDDLFGQTDQPALEEIATPEPAVQVVSDTRTTNDALENTESRVWIDNTGLYRTEGRLIRIADDHIKLLKANGKTCTVPFARLSDSDSEYLQSIIDQMETYVIAMAAN
ncbi:SHD1 domain-containing protein [Neorhodopirellula lusitana]|nr:SHD1 domain-containing protein [Neorhodopirellula lusitana]